MLARLAPAGFLCALAPALFAQAPLPVSPGAGARWPEVAAACPTFSWTPIGGAREVELAVFELAEGAEETRPFQGARLALRAALPGAASTFTPALPDCLLPGRRYGWALRALAPAEEREPGSGAGAGDWSPPLLFGVSAAGSEVVEALAVLRRFARAHALDDRALAALVAAPADVQNTAPEGTTASSRSARSATPAALAQRGVFDGVPVAVSGRVGDPSGPVVGVEGVVASPSGAAVRAVNEGGGADLVLDGSEDGEPDAALSQGRLDRASASAQSFDVTNSAGGGIELRVSGQRVWHAGNDGAASGLDADLLDGADGATFATDLELAAQIAGHHHDPRYYTKTQLNTSAGGGAVHWSNLTGVPAGFADGTDDIGGGGFTVGAGLELEGGVLRIAGASTETVATGDAGYHSSIAIGGDGLPLVSFYDAAPGDLEVAHCSDARCAAATITTIDSAGDVGLYTSLAIGADGRGLISYYDETNRNLKVAHCNDVACTTATVTTIDGGLTDAGLFSSLAIGSDGFGLIAYYDQTDLDLRVAHCQNTLCTAAGVAILDSPGDVGAETALAIGADGRGLISYYDNTSGVLKTAHCNDVACSTASKAPIDTSGDVGVFTSITIGADGRGLIAYADSVALDLKVAHCSNIRCDVATISTLDAGGDTGFHTSIAIGADGLGLIAYHEQSAGDLRVAHCDNVLCTSAVVSTLDAAGEAGVDASLRIGPDGLGLISHADAQTGVLRVSHCPNRPCLPLF